MVELNSQWDLNVSPWNLSVCLEPDLKHHPNDTLPLLYIYCVVVFKSWQIGAFHFCVCF